MTIEQKPELNRFVDYSIPLTWAKRWRGFKTTLPIWVFIFLCITEMAVLGAWFADRLSWDVIAPVAGSLPVFFVMFWGMIELQVWFYARSKRILRVGDKRIVVSPAKQQYIRLKSVTKFQFEPIAENPALTKLSVFVYFSKRIPAVRRFSMIVADPAQVQELVQTLEVRRQATGADFKIIVLDKPDPPPAKTSLCFMSLSGFFCRLLSAFAWPPAVGDCAATTST